MAGVSVTIGGNFSKLDELQKKAQSVAEKIKTGFSERIGQRAFDGLVSGAQAAFAAVTTGVKSALDAGGKLTDAMARTGAKGQGLVIMGQMFKNAGLEAENVAPALNKMQKALAGVNEDGEPTSDAFQKLGLSIGELSLMDPVAAFQKLGTAIAGIPDPAKRAEAAISIFGKSGGGLLAVMTDSGAWSTAEKQVGSLADTLTNSASQMDAASDGIDGLDNKMKQLYASLAVQLLPTIEKFLKFMESMDGKEFAGMLEPLIGEVLALGKAYAWVIEQGSKLPQFKWIEKMGENSANANAQPITWQKPVDQSEIASKAAQIEAEAKHASAVRDSEKAYKKAREAYDAYIEKTSESGSKVGTIADQLASLDAAEKKVREGMNYALQTNYPGADSATLAAAVGSVTNANNPDRGKDMEQVQKLAEIEAQRVALTAKKAEQDAQAAAKREEAMAAYDEELGILRAQIEGGAEKLLQLQREADIRAEINKLNAAGITGDEARHKATAEVDARRAALIAGIERQASQTLGDARAVANGTEDQRAQEKRAAELRAQGVSPERANSIAQNESSLSQLTSLKSQADGLNFQSSLGRVSDMQRIGGGGGVVDSGLDYARQSADLQRQMVALLSSIASNTPSPSLEY